MASTGFVAYVRPYGIGGTAAARSTGFVGYFPVRAVSGVYQSGVQASVDWANKRPDIPSAIAPFGYVEIDGKRHAVRIDPAWFRFLLHQYQVVQGGINGPTIPDIESAVTVTQAAASTAAQQAQALAVKTQTNAEALAATRTVVQRAALNGSDQIPGVEL